MLIAWVDCVDFDLVDYIGNFGWRESCFRYMKLPFHFWACFRRLSFTGNCLFLFFYCHLERNDGQVFEEVGIVGKGGWAFELFSDGLIY